MISLSQTMMDRIAEALGAGAPDHAAHVDSYRSARLRALYAAPALDWPGLVVSFPARAWAH